MKKIKGFTLAEVLITLAIIGVVAALTIPTVVAKYQNKQYYIQFMKTFNTLSNAASMASAVNGTPDTWGIASGAGREEINNQIIMNNFAPFLKISKTCDSSANYANCGITNDINVYDPKDSEDWPYPDFLRAGDTMAGRGTLAFLLNDGALVVANLTSWYDGGITFLIDINGPKKGPNIYGKDIFDGLQYQKLGNKYQLSAFGLFNVCDNPNRFCLQSTEKAEAQMFNGCKRKSYLYYCAASVLHEGESYYDNVKL